MRPIHAVGWHRIRIAAGLAYFAYLAVTISQHGVPTGRKQLAYLVVIGLAITCLGRGWRRMLLVVVDWLPFTVVLMFYDQSRAIADTMGMPLHERDIARAELYLADELFMTGTAAELTPIREIDEHVIAGGEPGPVTRRVQQLFDDALYGRDPRYTAWNDLVPVATEAA